MNHNQPQRTGPSVDPMPFIPLSVPEIKGHEWEYVKDCLDTGWVSSVGSYVDRFERDVAACVGVKRAVATVNGTAALHIALLLAGVERDDEVVVSTLTFIAPVNAIRYVGAWPLFIDAEPGYWQMDVAQVKSFLEEGCRAEQGGLRNRRTGRRIAAILPVHILGHPVDMDPLLDLARRFDLPVIEDATECLGALYKGRRVGSLGDAACFSFNGNKIITTGGGGMIATNRDGWADRAKYLTTQAKDDPVEYVHNEIGYNYRLTNLQAAMGCAQIEQIEGFIARKREIAAVYESDLSAVAGLQFMREAPCARSIFWMVTVLIDAAAFGISSRQLMDALAALKIQTRPLWRPAHMNRPYEALANGPLPVSERLYRDALSLPASVGMTDADLRRVVDAIRCIHGN